MNKKDRAHYVETDDSCAICGIRGLNILSEHHIDSDRTNNEYDNLIVLCHNCHHAYTNGKGLSREDIERRKRNLIKKTITTYGLNTLRIANRQERGTLSLPSLVYHLIEFGYLEDDPHPCQMFGDLKPYIITEKGKKLLKKWFS